MTTTTAIIIAFPNANRPIEAKLRRNRFVGQRTTQSDAQLTLDKRADAQGLAEAIAARPGPRTMTADEHSRHVDHLVRVAIRSAERRGVRLESMLSIPRGWLLDRCDEGDPTCLVVRDWLTGGRPDLPQHLKDTAAAWHANQKGDA